ncbi:MAG: 2-phospho-L-lactate transferase [Proteobacteria bacterium]|nr:2-phospho-L-lactate transferase [Pseudomonadota bacterium]
MTDASQSQFVALSGGVGGAKLALGLAEVLAPEQLTIVANTGDDFEHLGFCISPDLDTVLYTLAGWNNTAQGWGQEGESWQFLDALGRLSGETWFSLGDRDLATHVVRTNLLKQGHSLSEVIAYLAEKMNIRHSVVPMTDDRVSTRVNLQSGGSLSFQHYFVRDRCEPVVSGFEFEGIDTAQPSAGFIAAVDRADAVIVCPSNPFVSVAPVLSLPGIQDQLADRPVVVVSNIVGGQALKGPAAKMMDELGMPTTALGVARHYRERYGELFDGFVLDRQDAAMEAEVQALGYSTIVTNTVMLTLQDKTELARQVLDFTARL